MLISVVNRSRVVTDAELQRAVRAINRQLEEDFYPHWQFGARLRVDGAGRVAGAHDKKVALPFLPGRRGDAVIYLQDKATLAGAEGFHDKNNLDVPYGFVFLDICKECGDDWSVALSHEAIELVGDPLSNLLVQGPHPHKRSHLVFHMFELCDPVSADWYEIDGVKVSNFVLPGWFARNVVEGARNDFQGRPVSGEALAPFESATGGFLCFYDGNLPEGKKWTQVHKPGDATAERRIAVKAAATLSRIARRNLHPG